MCLCFNVLIPASVTARGRVEFRKTNKNFDSVDLFLSSFSEEITKTCLGSQTVIKNDQRRLLQESDCGRNERATESLFSISNFVDLFCLL